MACRAPMARGAGIGGGGRVPGFRRRVGFLSPLPVPVDMVMERACLRTAWWEAFVSGKMKVAGTSLHDDARLACEAFVRRWPDLVSDICPEPAMNHAVSAAYVAGLAVPLEELVKAAVVVAVTEGVT